MARDKKASFKYTTVASYASTPASHSFAFGF